MIPPQPPNDFRIGEREMTKNIPGLLLPWLLVGCVIGSPEEGNGDFSGDDDTTPVADDDISAEDDDTTPVADDDTTGGECPAFTAPQNVPLPFATAGESIPSGTLAVSEVGGCASSLPLAVIPSGPFLVEGDFSALSAGELRSLTVSYTGPIDEPTVAIGTATLSIGSWTTAVDLAAVLGDPQLPPADWITDVWGTRAVVPLPSAPFPHAGDSWTDASVLVALPVGFSDPQSPGVVTHLHGWNAVLEETVSAKALIPQLALSGRDAVMIVPQGPVDASSGDFGKLMNPGGHANLVRDALSLLYRDGFSTHPVSGLQVITSHSGGYQAAAAMVQEGGLSIHAVHLFDSLYGEEPVFLAFALDGGVLRSSWTDSGGTDDVNALLASHLQSEGLSPGTKWDDDSLGGTAVTVGRVDSAHDACLTDERHFARWLRASGLAPSPAAPPELRSTVAEGEETVVDWLPDPGDPTRRIRVEGSDDGENWKPLGEGTSGELSVPPKPYLRAVAISESGEASPPSDTYGATGVAWLVVDGFDRVLGGSWTEATHPFAAALGGALGAPFSVASNEAVARGEVELSDWPAVLWLLGDEGSADDTFDDDEKIKLEGYLNGGGTLLVTGSEVGYATSSSWFQDVLETSYLSDDAGTTQAGGYTFGVAYEEDYPDVLSGEDEIWTYATSGGAAVGRDHRILVVGFPLETLEPGDLPVALGELVAYLE